MYCVFWCHPICRPNKVTERKMMNLFPSNSVIIHRTVGPNGQSTICLICAFSSRTSFHSGILTPIYSSGIFFNRHRTNCIINPEVQVTFKRTLTLVKTGCLSRFRDILNLNFNLGCLERKSSFNLQFFKLKNNVYHGPEAIRAKVRNLRKRQKRTFH